MCCSSIGIDVIDRCFLFLVVKVVMDAVFIGSSSNSNGSSNGSGGGGGPWNN